MILKPPVVLEASEIGTGTTNTESIEKVTNNNNGEITDIGNIPEGVLKVM